MTVNGRPGPDWEARCCRQRATGGCGPFIPAVRKTGPVAMREDCRHFQSRTYGDGEVARFCVLDLAPEAPWRCPADCPRYEKGLSGATFVAGSLVPPPVEDEPGLPEEDVSGVLDAAELIVTADDLEAVKEIDHQRGARRWWRPRGKKDGGPRFGTG